MAAAMLTYEADAAGDEHRLLLHAACALTHLVTDCTVRSVEHYQSGTTESTGKDVRMLA